MKKLNATHKNTNSNRLPLRSETVRILTARELSLVAAGNCFNGSQQSQNGGTNLVGVC